MNTKTPDEKTSHSLNELCVLADVSIRTARYYIQIGLVARPEGETRSARYSVKHLEQLLQIRKWTQAGLSLERIRDLLKGEDLDVPPRPIRPGHIAVKSHVEITDGLELVIDPSRANLTTDEVREFVKAALSVYEHAIQKKTLNYFSPLQ